LLHPHQAELHIHALLRRQVHLQAGLAQRDSGAVRLLLTVAGERGSSGGGQARWASSCPWGKTW
jgi:hypothetical protein